MTSDGALLKLAREFGKWLLAFALPGFGLYGLLRYKTHALVSFCQHVSPHATPASVVAQAKAMGFPVFDMTKNRSVVSIQNQASPFFRFACTVSFKDGQVVARHVDAAD